MAFRFKQFSISDDKCAMKIGADAVLLGAWCHVNGAKQVLDIGTGSGVIALMLAQRSPAKIQAIEIEPLAAEQAKQNAMNSPWSAQLSVTTVSLQEFMTGLQQQFDLLVCNPPFFNNSLLSPAALRNQSRHTGEMPHDMLALAFSKLSAPQGKCCVILPVAESILFEGLMQKVGLYPTRRMLVFPKPGKKANRAMIQFERQRSEKLQDEILYIRNEDNSYSNDYQELTSGFYLNF